MAYVIREFEHDDLEPAQALLVSSIAGGVANFHWEPPPPCALEEAWLMNRERYPWLSAELDGTWAGFASAGPYKSREAYKWTVETSIYMQEWARGVGHGRSLYASLLEALGERGFRTVIAGIALPGEASCGLHRALGFTQAGVLREVGWKLGAWRDVSIWQRGLGPVPK